MQNIIPTSYSIYATLLFISCKEKINSLILWLCVKGEREREREREILFIIILDSLYYFIKLYVKIKLKCKMNCKIG